MRREFPALVERLAAIEGIDDLSLTTNGYLLADQAADLVAAGIDRVNVSIDSLARARFFEITRRDALDRVLRRARRDRRLPRGQPGQGQRGADARPRSRGRAALLRPRPRARLPGPLHRVHAARRRPRLAARGRADRCRGAGDDRGGAPARRAPARAPRHRPRLRLRRRARRDRLHQPGLRTVLRRLQPHPPDRRRQAPHLPLLPARDRPARAAARGRRRRRARADRPRRGLAQGAEAPDRRARLPRRRRGR